MAANKWHDLTRREQLVASCSDPEAFLQDQLTAVELTHTDQDLAILSGDDSVKQSCSD